MHLNLDRIGLIAVGNIVGPSCNGKFLGNIPVGGIQRNVVRRYGTLVWILTRGADSDSPGGSFA